MLLALVAAPAHAALAACFAGQADYFWPEPEAADVPAGAVPFALLQRCDAATSHAQLLDAEGVAITDEIVDVEAAAAGQSRQVYNFPAETDPDSDYTLRVTGADSQAVESVFSTGESRAEALTEGPTVEITLAYAPTSTLGGGVAGDAEFRVTPPEGALLLRVVDDTGAEVMLQPPSWLGEASTYATHDHPLGGNLCFTASALDATGAWIEGPESCATVQERPGALGCGLLSAGQAGAFATIVAGMLTRRRRSGLRRE